MRALSALLLASLALGCRDKDDAPGGPGVGLDGSDGADGTDGGSLPAGTIEGLEADAGFGSALAFDGATLLVGAPHGAEGAVYAVSGDSQTARVEGPGKLGAALAARDGVVLVGAPLDDQALVLGAPAAVEAPSAGLAVAAGADGAWAVATGAGVVTPDGEVETPARPRSLAFAGAILGVGLADGPVAAILGEVELPRAAGTGEAGFALAAGDVDGDGALEWLVGAPGAGVVTVHDAAGAVEHTLTAPLARFGAALAVADVDGDGIDDVLVGAPGAVEHRGAALLFQAGDLSAPAATWEGAAPFDQLGFAVALTDGSVALGAPGGPGTPGTVRVVEPPE